MLKYISHGNPGKSEVEDPTINLVPYICGGFEFASDKTLQR